jgi:hypothetical protein
VKAAQKRSDQRQQALKQLHGKSSRKTRCFTHLGKQRTAHCAALRGAAARPRWGGGPSGTWSAA